MLSRIDLKKNHTQALCLVNSNEVAVQTAELIAKLAAVKQIKIGIVHRANIAIPSSDNHLIIGTPKEIAGLRLLGIYKPKNLSVVVFDDADVVASGNAVKELINKLPSQCQKLFMSSHSNKLFKFPVMIKFLNDETAFPHHIDNYFFECSRAVWKFSVLQALSEEIYKDGANGQIVVFFNVNTIYC